MKSLFLQLSSPEAFATSIRILLMFSIVLAHSRRPIPTFFKILAGIRAGTIIGALAGGGTNLGGGAAN